MILMLFLKIVNDVKKDLKDFENRRDNAEF